MSGTFRLDGELFPVDPLKKRWSRNRSSIYGTSAPGFQDVWSLSLQFPVMEIRGKSDFFQAKFMAGGLHTVIVVGPHNDDLVEFTGVAIENYSYTIPPVDNQYWAQNPVLELSINIFATGTA